MGIAGTAMQANAASKVKDRLNWLAETPGIDLGQQTQEAGRLASGTQALESQRNAFNATELKKMLEGSIPGYSAAQKQRMMNTQALLSGDIPPDVAENIQRSSVAKSLEGGYGGSGAGRNLTARDLGVTSLGLMGQGNQQFSGIIGSTPRAPLADYTWSPQQIENIRANELDRKLKMQWMASQAPGKTQIWGKQLQTVGDQIGLGALGNMGGGKGGGNGSGAYIGGTGWQGTSMQDNSDTAMRYGGV